MRYISFVRSRISDSLCSIIRCIERTQNYTLPVERRFQQTQLQRRQPAVVALPATPRGVAIATADSRRSIALQRGPQRRPFGVQPSADQHDRRDDRHQHDAEQNRIFNERSALLAVGSSNIAVMPVTELMNTRLASEVSSDRRSI